LLHHATSYLEMVITKVCPKSIPRLRNPSRIHASRVKASKRCLHPTHTCYSSSNINLST